MGISTIEKRSEGLTTFVSDFRSLAHIPMPKFTAIRIQNLFDQVEKLFESQLKADNISLVKTVSPTDLLLFADCSLIEQVMINLSQNAEHTVENKEEELRAINVFIDDNGRIIIEVSDSGKGIEEEALSKISIPCFTTRKKGTGTGLSMSKQILRRHKGNIQ